jgi:3-methyladenine DNA glycosylase AlkD
MTTDRFVLSVREALTPLADAQRAAEMRKYMRDQFEFLGIGSVPRRKATAALLRDKRSPNELIASASRLWKLPQREYQYIAMDLLGKHRKVFTMKHVEDLLALAQQNSWWDTVDGLADIVGDVIRTTRKTNVNAQKKMDAALRHKNMWVRRIAMLHQLGWGKETDVSRLFDYALELAPETDFFIRKAIGWALRDYARHAPEDVLEFLVLNQDSLSPLTVREAAKHL